MALRKGDQDTALKNQVLPRCEYDVAASPRGTTPQNHVAGVSVHMVGPGVTANCS